MAFLHISILMLGSVNPAGCTKLHGLLPQGAGDHKQGELCEPPGGCWHKHRHSHPR